MDVIVIDTPQLGDRSYLVHDGDVALLVDAQRDIDRVEAAAEKAGVQVASVPGSEYAMKITGRTTPAASATNGRTA